MASWPPTTRLSRILRSYSHASSILHIPTSTISRPVKAALLERIDAAAARLLDALSDPGRRVRTVVIVLAAYWAVWTIYAVVAKASQDFHFDMGEMVAWSREVTFGTPKHPPLPTWP